jgi:hypothetical protein
MRAKLLIAIAVLGGVLLVALAIIVGPRPRPATSDDRDTVDVPLHFFVADDHTNRRVVNCGASASADRIGHLRDQQLFPCRFEQGWLRPSPWGTWSNAERSRLTVALEKPAPRRLLLACRAQPHTDPGRGQTMTVEVNGYRVADLDRHRTTIELAVDAVGSASSRRARLPIEDTRFDVFSDPDYDGRCDGESTTLWAINDRRIQPTETDLRQIVALYDGNLRAADDAVNMVLTALQRRSRWRQTVVLITADHGEAFFEHGMMTHSSTVYGEMLHVPFILRVPPSLRSDRMDTARLVSLADIVPTLLGTASLRPHGSLEGTNLLRDSDPIAHGGRFLVTRNGNQLPLLGFRAR